MAIYLANGNPVIAVVLMSLSTFKRSALIASFQSVSLSFSSEEVAKKFVGEARPLGCNQSGVELNNVVVVPDFAGSENAARAIYHAVNAYKDHLVSVNKFEIDTVTDEEDKLLKDIEQYIKEHFGSDAVTVQ